MKIEIPHDAKKIGVLCSGGVDSTLLLYLLVKQNFENIMVFTFFQKRDKKYKILENIVNTINEKFSIHCLNNNFFIRIGVQNIIDVIGCDYVYTGCNKVIWDENEFVPTIHIPNDTPPVRGDPLNEKHLRPFINMDKIEIVKLYIEHNIIDLLQSTRSCGYPNGYVNPCGGCYFCTERKWALTKLGLEDIYK